MGKTNAQVLDDDGFVAARLKLGTHLQALEDGHNQLLAFGQLGKLLAQLDADVLTASDYVATTAPAIPGDTLAKFNALLVKLDADAIVADAGYAALLTAATLADLVTNWPLLLAKLDADAGVPFTDYAAKNALPFLKTINLEKSF